MFGNARFSKAMLLPIPCFSQQHFSKSKTEVLGLIKLSLGIPSGWGFRKVKPEGFCPVKPPRHSQPKGEQFLSPEKLPSQKVKDRLPNEIIFEGAMAISVKLPKTKQILHILERVFFYSFQYFPP